MRKHRILVFAMDEEVALHLAIHMAEAEVQDGCTILAQTASQFIGGIADMELSDSKLHFCVGVSHGLENADEETEFAILELAELILDDRKTRRSRH